MDKLKKLLNFDLDSQEAILKQADEVAIYLLNNFALINNLNEEKRLNTIEFYVANKILPDYADTGGATHKREEQKSKLNFYVHTKSKTSWTLPIFNRHGVDITCGNNSTYGGILIREIENPLGREGSGCTLRAILRGDEGYVSINSKSPSWNWSDDEKLILEKLNNSSVFNSDLNIKLKKVDDRNEVVYKGARVGIDKTEFADLKLRYSITKKKGLVEKTEGEEIILTDAGKMARL